MSARITRFFCPGDTRAKTVVRAATLARAKERATKRRESAEIEALVPVLEQQERAEDDLLGEARALKQRALAVLQRAEAAGQLAVALAAIREARGLLELLGKLDGQLADRSGSLSVQVVYVDKGVIAGPAKAVALASPDSGECK